MFSRLKLTRRIFLASTVAFTIAACQSASTPTTPTSADTPATTSAMTAPQVAGGKAVSLSGAGASFPAPLYQSWFAEYNKLHPNIQISYQSVGSGAGVKQFTAATVDFGASDTGMDKDEIAKVKNGVLLVPVTAGSIVFAYNLPDIKELKLSRKVYVDILLGKIKQWNDPEIAKLNEGVNLPDQAISVVYRSDGSGTTGVFTKHLSAISADWKNGPGEGKTIQWPVGTGAKGNEGVTAQIQQTPGAIGYIEYGYAKQNNLSFATIENKAGKYVVSGPETNSRSLANIELPADFLAFDPDPKGDDSYPIVSYSWIMAYTKYDDPDKSATMKAMLNWALTDGQKFSADLGYIPLPSEVADKVKPAVDKIAP